MVSIPWLLAVVTGISLVNESNKLVKNLPKHFATQLTIQLAMMGVKNRDKHYRVLLNGTKEVAFSWESTRRVLNASWPVYSMIERESCQLRWNLLDEAILGVFL